jgi:hypothetical protein
VDRGSLAMDRAGNLYVSWDTQRHSNDTGWLAYSTNHGRTWSKLWRATPDVDGAPHIVEVIGGSPGKAYVAWLTDSSPHGYAEYLRPFSTARGWLSPPIRISHRYGSRSVWPGVRSGSRFSAQAHPQT